VRRLALLGFLCAASCTGKGPVGPGDDDSAEPTPPTDEDHDGFYSDEDCDDYDSNVYPGTTEICDGVDDDCDGEIDEGVTSTYYADADGDGYGDEDSPTQACSKPTGYVPVPNDCDDHDDTVWPGAAELCDGQDQDCDGDIDEGVTSLYYVDADEDGYGDPNQTTPSCEGLPGASDDPTDCDDGDDSVHPGADEHCDGLDNDCDGLTDEEPTVEGGLWYPDADGDGFGDPDGETSTICVKPAGYTADTSDCDDRDDAVNPDATETCSNEIDDDCDGDIDEGCPVEHCGTITADETWTADHVHVVTCDVVVGSTAHPVLTIEDGVEVDFVTGTGLYVGTRSPATMNVEGSASGVLFTSDVDPVSAGDWTELELGYYDEGSSLAGFTLEGGGGGGYGALLVYGAAPTLSDCTITGSASAGVYGRVGADIAISGCTISDNADDGIALETSSDLGALSDTTLSGNGGFPLTLPANSLANIDASSSYTGNADDRIQVLEDDVTVSATWGDYGLPYYIAGDVDIQGSATPTVEVEDGVILRFARGVGLTVGVSSKGILDVRGDVEGVSLSSDDDDSPGAWDGLSFGPFDEGSTIERAEILYGGGNGYGGVYLNSADAKLSEVTIAYSDGAGVYARNGAAPDLSACTIQDNDGYGVYIHDDAGLASGGSASFTDNTVTGNADEGVVLPAGAVGQLDDSSTYTGNDVPGVRVLEDTLDADATWQLLDEDYVIAGDVQVYGTARPVLTLSAGLTLGFEAGAGLLIGVDGHGGLNATGTRSKPITLTSAAESPAEGDWDGVTFGDRCDSSDVSMSYVTVAWGGANGYGDLLFDTCDGSVSNSTISGSSTWGIYRLSASPTLTNITYSGNALGTLY